ncbi:hypothetical protein BX666DRAFT_2003239 [Dichotomocladium elegans]|nr:hypothetical protein BX666DRAFT_2003239 [Dichotomocladium elegans]
MPMASRGRPTRSEMPVLVLLLLLLLLDNLASAQRYGYPTNETTLPSSVGQYIYSTMFSTGNALYLYGGIDDLHPTGSNQLSRFSFNMEDNGQFQYQNFTSGGYATYFADSVVVNNETGIIFGSSVSNLSAIQFTVAEYSISTQSWFYPTINSSAFAPSMYFDVTLASDGRAYITGGYHSIDNGTLFPTTDVWSYDPVTHTFQQHAVRNPALYSHTGVGLPDGSIIYLGGSFMADANDAHLQNLTSATIYTPSTDSWRQQNLTFPTTTPAGVEFPTFPHNLNAVLGPEKRYIYVYGGDSDLYEYPNRYAYNELFVLDTQTWTWYMPYIDGAWPTKRMFTTSALFHDNYFVIYGGYDGSGTYYPEVDVLFLPTQTADGPFNPSGFRWIVNLVTNETYEGQNVQSLKSSLSTASKVGAIIGSILAAIIIGALLYYCHPGIRSRIQRFHYQLWEPRTGEPAWTETMRLVTRIILIFLFISLLVILLFQVAGSAKAVTQIYEESPDGTVDVPDIRICTEGYEDVLITCSTTAGINCDDYFTRLDLSLHAPYYSGKYPNITCHLFMPPPAFRLSNRIHPGQNYGFRIMFYVNLSPIPTPPPSVGYTHVTLYPASRDPNRYVYFNETAGFTSDEITSWVNIDSNDFTATNILDLEHMSAGTIHYKMIEKQYLAEGDNWNYVGFMQHRTSVADIQTEIRTSKLYNSNSTAALGTPARFVLEPIITGRIVEKEQFVYPLVNVVGYLGGIFSFFVFFQQLMFGFRPQSPWGIVHRWSTGSLKRSISRNLRSRFDALQTPVPLVNPVHRRFSSLNVRRYGKNSAVEDDDYSERDSAAAAGLMGSMEVSNHNNNHNNNIPSNSPSTVFPVSTEDNDRRRIEQVEERIQLLELLFKCYYVDDEIFRRLDEIMRQRPDYDAPPGPPTTSGGVVSRLFRRRQTSDDVDNTRGPLHPSTPNTLDEAEAMRSLGGPRPTTANRNMERWAEGVSTGVNSSPWTQHPRPPYQHHETDEKNSIV